MAHTKGERVDVLKSTIKNVQDRRDAYEEHRSLQQEGGRIYGVMTRSIARTDLIISVLSELLDYVQNTNIFDGVTK